MRQPRVARSLALLESTDGLKKAVTLTSKEIHELRLAGELLEDQIGKF
jgi:hypothetical protein